jgi:protein-disulfide isomerase
VMSVSDRWRSLFPTGKTVFLIVIFAGIWILPPAGLAEEIRQIYSRGAGPTEVMIFTDYFCPPCQAVEPYLETALTDLYRSGVKVTFVDKPINARTPLYSRYFLYAARAAPDFEEVLHIRRAIFQIAGTQPVDTESELLRRLKENDIRLGLFDVQPVFEQWAELIGRFGVRSTPTCVVIRPGHESVIYVGSREIPEGIDRLIHESIRTPESK